MTPPAEFRAQADEHEQAVTVASCSDTTKRGDEMNGWLVWGLILPVLLVVAGIVTIRRRNHRP